MKVIDSSALIQYLAKEENWKKVEDHLKEGCVTLDLAVKEVANALVKKALRSEVNTETAEEIIDHLPKVVRIAPEKDHFPKALEIAIKHKIAIYDALFIALSANTNTPLLTSDQEQASISKENGVEVTII